MCDKPPIQRNIIIGSKILFWIAATYSQMLIMTLVGFQNTDCHQQHERQWKYEDSSKWRRHVLCCANLLSLALDPAGTRHQACRRGYNPELLDCLLCYNGCLALRHAWINKYVGSASSAFVTQSARQYLDIGKHSTLQRPHLMSCLLSDGLPFFEIEVCKLFSLERHVCLCLRILPLNSQEPLRHIFAEHSPKIEDP